jgi:hypothetical protein
VVLEAQRVDACDDCSLDVLNSNGVVLLQHDSTQAGECHTHKSCVVASAING